MIEPNCVGAQQPAHSRHQIGIGSFNHQMEVISHQAISMRLPSGFLADFGESLQKILPIHIVQENVFPPVATTHHVVDATGVLDSQFSWQEQVLPSQEAKESKK